MTLDAQVLLATPRMVEIATLGERLSALHLCDAAELIAMRRSFEYPGQLSALSLFVAPCGLAIAEGLKRMHATRASSGPSCASASGMTVTG